MNMKAVDIYKRNFVEIIISISFFRVPEFREKFISCLSDKSKSQLLIYLRHELSD
jgi:hypothetical protein